MKERESSKSVAIERDIIVNSYYMINLFYKHSDENIKFNISITNLKLQKLMYFVEAYYMVENQDERQLYYDNWSAWDYGPVNQNLYNYYKRFGSMEIHLTEEEKNMGESLSSINKKYIEKVYNIFGKLTAFDLVTLTHLPDSPWSKIHNRNKINKIYDFDTLNDSTISKEETKEWFSKRFNFLFIDSGENNKK